MWSKREKEEYLSDIFYKKDRQQTYDWRIGRAYTSRWGNFGCPRYYFVGYDPEMLDGINQREQLKSEIILEFDVPDNIKGTSRSKGLFCSLLTLLRCDGILFEAYMTPSGRSMHIETFWDKLGVIHPDSRRFLRSKLIRHYGCDMAYESDKKLVSVFEHYKTGDIKRKIDGNCGHRYINNIKKVINLIPEVV